MVFRTATALSAVGGTDLVTASAGGACFSAVTGYDLVTGWGSPKPGLINELAP